MTDMKLRFFTDISHELRTPLTLISGPVEYVLEHTQLPADAREQLQVVERNTNRMLRLINQILDFRKIQNKNEDAGAACQYGGLYPQDNGEFRFSGRGASH